MSQTRILDLVPSEKVLGQTVQPLIKAKNAFLNSGSAVVVQSIAGLEAGGPRKVSVPYIKPLNTDEFNYGIDDNTVVGKTSKIQGDEFTAIRHDLNNGYTYTDLVQMITRANTKGLIQNGLSQYWNGVHQKIAVASIKGALAATSASALNVGDGSDPFSFGLAIDGAATAGENMDMFTTLVVHSGTYANILKRYKPIYDANTGLFRIGGYNLIVDNSFGATKTVLLRDGALAVAYGNQPVPIEIDRAASGGNGSGAETLWTRSSIVTHPQGFNFVGAVPTGSNFGSGDGNNAIINALSTGTNWTTEFDATQIGIRMLNHSTGAIPSEVIHVNVDNIEDTPTA